MTERHRPSKEDWELEKFVDERIDHKLDAYDERLWERIEAWAGKNIHPQFQQLYFGYSLLKWIAGLVGMLAIGTIWQIITSVVNSIGGGA